MKSKLSRARLHSPFISFFIVPILIAATGCNVFSFSGPSGDTQLLSAARACFDNGDFACASKDYQQLSSNDSDIAISEQAFMVFDQQNAAMSNFMQFIGDVDNSISVGNALTNFAQRMNVTAGQSSRVTIWTAFDTYPSIHDASLQQFVRFVGALGLVGEILAETQGADSQLHQSDIVSNPTACLAASSVNCAVTAGCGTGTGNLTATATPTAIDPSDGTAASPSETHPSADHLNDAIESVVESLTALNAEGKFGSTLTTLAALFKTTAPSANAAANQCFRYALISQGVGY